MKKQLFLATLALPLFAACAPVANSITKIPSSSGISQPNSPEFIFSQLEVISHDHDEVVTEEEALRAMAKFPAEVKMVSLSDDQVEDFKVFGSIEVETQGDVRLKAIEVYALMELDVPAREANRNKMRAVKMKWVKSGLNRFKLSLSKEDSKRSSVEYVKKYLSRISIGYREIGTID